MNSPGTFEGVSTFWRSIKSNFVESIVKLEKFPKPTLALALGLVTLTVVLPTFNQGDLTHTVLSSYGYLQGHFFDFYDFNLSFVGGNSYLPILYLIFAAWMAPYYFLGFPIASEFGDLALFPGEIIWAKVLLIVFFVLSARILLRIAELIHPNNRSRQAIATWAFTLSPFALFAFGIFSQYDILGVFFTLWAFQKLLQKQLNHFAILIGVALTFKFFAGLLVLPLLLLSSKKIFEIARLGLLASVPLTLQLAAYWSNEAFRNQIFGLAFGKASGAAATSEIYLVMSIYIFMCFAAVFSNKWKGTFEQKAVLFAVTTYGLMFSVVVWHPQWLIIITPFIALMVSMIPAARTWILWESVAFVAFIAISVTQWKYNVDGLMIENGALASEFPSPKVLVSDFYPIEWMSTFRTMLTVFFWAPTFLLLIQIFRDSKVQERVGGATWFTRVGISWIAFIGPAIWAVFIPMDMAVNINRNAAVSEMQAVTLSSFSQIPIGEIVSGVEVTQTFVTTKDFFSGIGLNLATYNRENNSKVLFEILNRGGVVVHSETVEAKTLKDNLPFAIAFEPQPRSGGMTYTLRISSDGQPGSSITAWSSQENSIKNGLLKISGSPQVGDLSLVLYYANQAAID